VLAQAELDIAQLAVANLGGSSQPMMRMRAP